MTLSFGERLRQQRERQHVDLRSIAEETKIKYSLLDELERDDVSHWPDGIFRRSFIRAYAYAIGLEPDVVLHEFLEVHPDPVGMSVTPSDPVPQLDRTEGGAASSRFRRWLGPVCVRLCRIRSGAARRQRDCGAAHAGGRDGSAISAAPVQRGLMAAAQLCTRLAQADRIDDVAPLLEEAAVVLDAVGLIVWIRDPEAAWLRPLLGHGYPQNVLAQLATVSLDSDSAAVVAFRSAHWCAVAACEQSGGALAVPLMTPAGCAGVLTVEFRRGCGQTESSRAVATILAAQFARCLGDAECTDSAGSTPRGLEDGSRSPADVPDEAAGDGPEWSADGIQAVARPTSPSI
jgi:transcriptional regulator with XRE-family HTH domain